MLTFAQPWFLVLLLLVPWIVRRWQRRRRPALRYSDTALLTCLPPGRSRVVQRMGAAARALALGLLIVGLAGPRWPDQSSRIPADSIAIVMLVDVSGSMATEDFLWHNEPIARMEAVKRAFHLFVAGGEGPEGQRLEGRPSDLIGLVAFAARPETLCPLTLSHHVPLAQLAQLEPKANPLESVTNISDAIVEGLDRVRRAPTRRKVLVLLSDGEHNVADPRSQYTPRQAAQLAGSLGIPIYTIDAGGDENSAPEGNDSSVALRAAGLRTLQDIARITGGRCFPARDTDSLLEVCQQIDQLERVRIASYQYRLYYEAFPWCGLLAFTLWFGVLSLEMTIWQRIP